VNDAEVGGGGGKESRPRGRDGGGGRTLVRAIDKGELFDKSGIPASDLAEESMKKKN